MAEVSTWVRGADPGLGGINRELTVMHAAVVLLSAALASSSLAPNWIGRFANPGSPPAPWRSVPYGNTPPTHYRVAAINGKTGVEAIVDRSMSLLGRPISVDLTKTPVLCWRWFVSNPVRKADMTRRGGDDYAARVYVAFDIPNSALSGSTKLKLKMARSLLKRDVPDAALVYVWDNTHPVGTARKSSYTDRSQLVVAETGASRAGSWVTERADVAADYARAFPRQPGTPTFFGIAADGDNTNSKGRAGFADIHFVGRDEPCAA